MNIMTDKNTTFPSPTIEIPLKDGSFCFPLAEFSNNKFLLTSIDAYLQLQEAIAIWIKENQKTTYDEYQEVILSYKTNIPTDEDNKREMVVKATNSVKKKRKPNMKSPKRLPTDDEDILIHTQISPNMKNKFESLYEYKNGSLMKPSEKKYYKNPRYHSKTGNLYNVMTKINTHNVVPDMVKSQEFYDQSGKSAIQIHTSAMKKSRSKKDRLNSTTNVFMNNMPTDTISRAYSHTNSMNSHKLNTSKGSHVNSVIRNSLVNYRGNPMVSNNGMSNSSENIYL